MFWAIIRTSSFTVRTKKSLQVLSTGLPWHDLTFSRPTLLRIKCGRTRTVLRKAIRKSLEWSRWSRWQQWIYSEDQVNSFSDGLALGHRSTFLPFHRWWRSPNLALLLNPRWLWKSQICSSHSQFSPFFILQTAAGLVFSMVLRTWPPGISHQSTDLLPSRHLHQSPQFLLLMIPSDKGIVSDFSIL